MEEKTSREIHDCIGIPVRKVSVYFHNNHKYKKTYEFEEVSSILKKEKQIPKTLFNEWDMVISMFHRKEMV